MSVQNLQSVGKSCVFFSVREMSEFFMPLISCLLQMHIHMLMCSLVDAKSDTANIGFSALTESVFDSVNNWST